MRRIRQFTEEERWREYAKAATEVLVDFDATLCAWGYPWMGYPIPGAQQFVQALVDRGLTPVVWSSRLSGRNTTTIEAEHIYNQIREWLGRHRFNPMTRVDSGESGKRLALAYVDDKGVGFRGDYDDCLRQIDEIREADRARWRAREQQKADNEHS